MVVIDKDYDTDALVDAILDGLMSAPLGTHYTDKLGIEWTYMGYQELKDDKAMQFLLAAGVDCGEDAPALEEEGCKILNVNLANHARLMIEVTRTSDSEWLEVATLHLPGGKPLIYRK